MTSRTSLLLALVLAACGGAGDGPPLPADLASMDPTVAAAIEEAAAGVRQAGDADAWKRLGLVYEANDLAGLALECYGHARELAPDDARLAYRSALACEKGGSILTAIGHMRYAAELAPEFAPARWRLGHWLLETGELAGARRELEAALEIDPSSVAAIAGLARVEILADEPEEAVATIQRAITLRRDDRYLRLLYGTALRQAGYGPEATTQFEYGRGGEPRWDDPWQEELLAQRVGASRTLARAKDLLARRAFAQSIGLFEELRRRRPTDVGLLNNLALAYSGAGDTGRARAVLEEALGLEPESFSTHLNLAVVELAGGDPAVAIERVALAIEIRPDIGRAHEVEGIARKRHGDPSGALAAFERAIGLDARNPMMRGWMADLQLQLGRWADAERTSIEATRLDPRDVESWVRLCEARVELGDLDGAASALTRAEELAGNDTQRLRDARAKLVEALSR